MSFHLLVRDRGLGEIKNSMQLVAGRTAQEYNQRKGRKGAFWEDRCHATVVYSEMYLVSGMLHGIYRFKYVTCGCGFKSG